MVQNVIEYRGDSTAGMLCSQIWRDAPDIMYSERGSASSVKRSQDLPADLRNRNLQADPSERPNVLSKCGLSRCQPMPTPTLYSVHRTRRRSVSGPPNVFDLRRDLGQPGRYRLCLLQLPQIIVIPEAERSDPPLPFELSELKRPEGKIPNPRDQFLFHFRRDKFGGVA